MTAESIFTTLRRIGLLNEKGELGKHDIEHRVEKLEKDIVAKDGSRIVHINPTNIKRRSMDDDEPENKIVKRDVVHIHPTNSKRPPAYDLSGKKDKTIIRLSEKQLTNLICIGKCTHKNITIIGTVSSKYGNTLLQNIFNTSQQLTYIRELQEEYLKKNKVDK